LTLAEIAAPDLGTAQDDIVAPAVTGAKTSLWRRLLNRAG
jgi:hypothetical protein